MSSTILDDCLNGFVRVVAIIGFKLNNRFLLNRLNDYIYFLNAFNRKI